MLKYILRRILTLLLTMLVVSVVIFAIVEVAPGNVARNILGHFATPEQERSMENQLGLDRPAHIRYISWLLGSDWQVDRPLVQVVERQGLMESHQAWWAVDDDGSLVQWDVVGGDLYKLVRQGDGSIVQVLDNESWQVDENGETYFWGIDTNNRAALWKPDSGEIEYTQSYATWIQAADAPVDYIPLTKGLVRGDLGITMIYRRPVVDVLATRLKNSAILAGLAFLIAMPVALLLGLLAGMNEGKLIDRVLSVGGLITTASPDFATGILLIMIFALWLKLLPGATVFITEGSLLSNPRMLVLPVATVSLMEIGYVLRITRVSVIDVMNSNYVRTAILKGLPYRRVLLRHVLRNALIAPVTVIMLHVNWLIGGLVVVESVFGYPGMGSYLLAAALYKDIYSIEGGTLVMIMLAIGSQLIADIIYAFLNPRIRYT
jgi:peptide/nickel transport system permease protein